MRATLDSNKFEILISQVQYAIHNNEFDNSKNMLRIRFLNNYLKFLVNNFKFKETEIVEAIKLSININNEHLLNILLPQLKANFRELILFCIRNRKIELLHLIIEKADLTDLKELLSYITEIYCIKSLSFVFQQKCYIALFKKVNEIFKSTILNKNSNVLKIDNDKLSLSFMCGYDELSYTVYDYYKSINKFNNCKEIFLFNEFSYYQTKNLNLFKYICNNPYSDNTSEFYKDILKEVLSKERVGYYIKFFEISDIFDEKEKSRSDEDLYTLKSLNPFYLGSISIGNLRNQTNHIPLINFLNNRKLVTKFN